MTEAIKYMKRCLQLAANGLGSTYPNPLVGCVIVCRDKIIAEGWHYQAGQAHAEVVAINQAIAAGYDQTHFAQATLYVNLEPCSHYGKTPPCADLVIKNGFKKVVIGTLDPNKKVAGNGIQKLQNAGIETLTGVETAACIELNKRFFMFHKNKRPYIILKWAQTADRFIAPTHKNKQQPVWITNSYSRQIVHKGRAQEHAILIGAATAMADNPTLTTRAWAGKQPQRFVITTKALPASLNLFTSAPPATVIAHNHPKTIIEYLFEQGIQSVIIEGGRKTLQRFIDHGLWDETQQYTATTLNLETGVPAPVLQKAGLVKTSMTQIAGDQLVIYRKQ